MAETGGGTSNVMMRRLGAYLGLIEDPRFPQRRPSRFRTSAFALAFLVCGVASIVRAFSPASLLHHAWLLSSGCLLVFAAWTSIRALKKG